MHPDRLMNSSTNIRLLCSAAGTAGLCCDQNTHQVLHPRQPLKGPCAMRWVCRESCRERGDTHVRQRHSGKKWEIQGPVGNPAPSSFTWHCPGQIVDWVFCPPPSSTLRFLSPKPSYGSFGCRIGLLTSDFYSSHIFGHSHQVAADICFCLSHPQ